MNAIEDFSAHAPVLVGVSRKRMIGEILNAEIDERLIGSVTAAAIAVDRGAKFIRVHDVAETRQAVDMAWALHKDKCDE
jgi:dihydropteroate synthase